MKSDWPGFLQAMGTGAAGMAIAAKGGSGVSAESLAARKDIADGPDPDREARKALPAL